MKRILILVEGESDLIFLRDVIFKSYSSLVNSHKIIEKDTKVKKQISKFLIELNNDKQLILKVCNQQENINSVGGWQELKGEIKFIEIENYDNCLILFDSDNSKKENIQFKKQQIKNWVNEAFDYQTFFLPLNDEKNGEDLEDLIINSVSEKYKNFFNCWQSLENCLKTEVKENLKYPDKKRKLFAFKDSLQNIDNGIFFNYNSDIWNLKAEYLNPLKDFLDKYLK
jgi:hypothetical protein